MSTATRQPTDTLATPHTTFEISGREELNRIIANIPPGIETVIDIERTAG